MRHGSLLRVDVGAVDRHQVEDGGHRGVARHNLEGRKSAGKGNLLAN